ncbi:hypothetical protein [Mucilaginibacter sp. CSA2-8R]|uniref:hypothetical protein n=1 Tax=Mucilaginibacter sp. CSA2-8R TaxID=3141542 RepID=UPI00315C7DBA
MKTPKLISAVALAIGAISATQAQNSAASSALTVSKAKANAISYLKAHQEVMAGYQVMGWSDLVTYKKPTNDPVLFKKANDPLLDNKIDSVIMLQKSSAPIADKPLAYTIMHTFKVNVPDSGMVRRDYTYYFDPTFNVISIDKRPADEKVKLLIQQLDNSYKVKRLIGEIRDYKIAHLKQN